jgi:LysW-gamma-L-lysine carboxypeptidase
MIDGREEYHTLVNLVERYSPSGEEAEVVDWLVKHMGVLGFTEAFIDETGNAVGVMGAGSKQVVLLGHIDTVPGEIPVRITQDPQGDPMLYGRGSVDAKGALASFVDAVVTLGEVDGFQIVVIGAIDEERESIGARGIKDQYRPDFAIIGEPSQWNRVTLGYKGSAWAEITVRRSMAHTAGQMESAPEAAVKFWNQVSAWARDFNRGQAKVFEQLIPTLRGFSSKEDGFEETATLKIGVRLPPGFSPPEWYDQLRNFRSWMEVDISPMGFPIPAYRVGRNNSLVRAFLGGIRKAGGKPGFVVKSGTADLNIVAPAWKCPVVAYGPGDSSLDHTPDEHLSLAEFNQAVAVLVAVLRRLSS